MGSQQNYTRSLKRITNNVSQIIPQDIDRRNTSKILVQSEDYSNTKYL